MRTARRILIAAMAAALGQMGCAAAFRDSRPVLRVESDPPGGVATVQGAESARETPVDVAVPRSGFTEVRVQLAGFEEHHGSVRKRLNGWWVTADLATCIVPVLLCVPLLVDAVSGAWNDVDTKYTAHLQRVVPQALPPAPVQVQAAPAPATTTVIAPPAPSSTISDSERKASARAAYQEGVELQAQGHHAEALARFQIAQHLLDAPTHLLHIAQCLAMTGKLVEAQETYETLTHRDLPKGSPQPFRDAVDTGKRELPDLQPRIPTLRIQIKPPPSTLRNLAVTMNQRPLPNEVLGIARPVNPGTYEISATAWGIAPSRPVRVTLGERDSKAVELKLGR